jgi:spermidine/putrescine transport system substrate-binding protein
MKKRFKANWGNTLFMMLLFMGIVTLFSSFSSDENPRKKILKIYNWADYIDEDLLQEFPVWYKEQTGQDIEIVYQVFEMTEIMYTKIAMGKEDYDLVCPSQYVVERMLKKDLLLPLDTNFGNTPNYLKNLSPYLMDRMDEFSDGAKNIKDYMVPYMWGTSGILYNTKHVTRQEVSSWNCLWDIKNKGKVLMKDNYWDVYNMVVIKSFYPEIASGKRTLSDVANAHTDTDIAVVEEQLKALKPNLTGWEADFGKEMMTKGEIWMSYNWSGDAVWSIQEAAEVGVSLDYEVPREGSNIWVDGWAIPKYAGNVKAASYFLNYICQPEIALRNMDVSGYSSCIASSEILESVIDSTLDGTINLSFFFGPGNDSVKVNHVFYPDSSVVSRCVFMHDFGDKNDAVLEMWSRAKGDNMNKGMAFFIVGVLMLFGGWLVYRKVKK